MSDNILVQLLLTSIIFIPISWYRLTNIYCSGVKILFSIMFLYSLTVLLKEHMFVSFTIYIISFLITTFVLFQIKNTNKPILFLFIYFIISSLTLVFIFYSFQLPNAVSKVNIHLDTTTYTVVPELIENLFIHSLSTIIAYSLSELSVSTIIDYLLLNFISTKKHKAEFNKINNLKEKTNSLKEKINVILDKETNNYNFINNLYQDKKRNYYIINLLSVCSANSSKSKKLNVLYNQIWENKAISKLNSNYTLKTENLENLKSIEEFYINTKEEIDILNKELQTVNLYYNSISTHKHSFMKIYKSQFESIYNKYFS